MSSGSTMSSYDFDVLVIGAGPAGESAALNAAKHDLSAAVIDDRKSVGGSCTHKGTIPSKALRSSVKTLMRYNSNPLIRDQGIHAQISYPKLLSNVSEIIQKQVRMRSKFYARNHIALYKGRAQFIDRHTVEIVSIDGIRETLTAKDIIIASGSRPYHPDNIDFDHPRIYDGDSILDMVHTPNKMIIYGAGVIGCEYASIFAGLGIKVELVNGRDRLLEFLDDEISDALSYHLRDNGVMVRHREHYERVEANDDGIVIHLQSGKRLHGDALLWCNGRSGNTEHLKLENVGLSPDHRGQLEVSQRYQTSVDNIFAAGDVIGWPSLASAAYNQGRAAAASARGKENCVYVDDVATGIYTIPEISSVGLTERELTEACIPYEVGRALFKDTARAQISGEDVGMLKILFHIDTLEVLGVHCFGSEATEIIHIGQAIMKQQGAGNTIRYFVTNTFNYPTMAEAYRIAALNGLNRLV
jgi:NAD(P) transhydrogenase